MPATLDDIDAAVALALAPLATPVGSTFKLLDRWTARASSPEALAQAVGQRTPAVLIAFERERATTQLAALSGDRDTVGRSEWTVLVVTADVREVAKGLKGTTGALGAYALASRAQAALTNLLVASPAATLTVTVTGTPGATVPLGASVLGANGVSYAPTTTSVVLDGSGNGTVTAACVTAGTLGDQLPGATLTWSPVPAGLASTGLVAAVATPGANGLYRNGRLQYLGTQPVPALTRPGQLYALALSFAAERTVPNAAQPDTSLPYLGTTGRERLVEGGPPPAAADPIVVFRDS